VTTGSRAGYSVLAFFCLFVISVVSAWAWFNLARPKLNLAEVLESGPSIMLKIRTNAFGYTFFEEPVGEEVINTLGTTDILNGQLVPAAAPITNAVSTDSTRSVRVRIFLATWRAENKAGLVVADHSPDICWPMVGWDSTELGQPKRLAIQVGRASVPFECRAFRSKIDNSVELVVWAVLIQGKALNTDPPDSSAVLLGDQQAFSTNTSNIGRIRRSQFAHLLKNRLSVRGERQFVRFSVPVFGDVAIALQTIRYFGLQGFEVSELSQH
jgi:hypothetical protein